MIKSITGTKDILPAEIPYWQRLESIVEKIFSSFNYKEIRTPVFEETNLFVRSIGEETDIVGKEMYTFNDKSNASITLKPEMTASVARAFIEHSFGKLQPLNKFYYISPMFRQERPQAGRQRQFHQFGGEALGSASPLLDAEIIIIAFRILASLNLKDLTVKINSLGIPSSRENYKNILRNHLDGKKNQLSEDSRKRFDKNILRIFDSKVESDQEIIKDAPVLIDFIDEESKKDFELVKILLKQSKVPFEVDTKLVRGLDYYTKTTFEIVSGKVGSQNALCGGGRYDLLIEQLGGAPTPGVGFAAGMERILLACQNEKSLNLPGEKIDLYITRVDEDLTQKVFELAVYFRQESLIVEFDYLGRSVKAQMREANKLNARFVLFVGGEEFKSKKLILKIMATGEQKEYPLEELNEIKSFIYDEDYKSYPNY
ncbi:MAG TPA: histidine--tRNA ligase [Ignavibacteriaceae bacterium]|nr:histidine--tRNA ligase [Ignavibacteriaceae bacterium]